MKKIRPLGPCNGGASEDKTRPAPPRNERYLLQEATRRQAASSSTLEPNLQPLSAMAAGSGFGSRGYMGGGLIGWEIQAYEDKDLV